MSTIIKAYDIKEERTAFPTPKQFRVEKNPSYLASLLAGVFSPILHLPQMVWFNIIWPLAKAIFSTMMFILLCMFAGITGRASGYIVTGLEERPATDEEKEKALGEMLAGTGYKAVKIDAEWKGASGEH